jgi:hypothetical protein
VFVIYLLNKRSFRREAATIVLNEIRNAEAAIDEIKRTKRITELNSVLPVSSWSKYKHLFIRSLDQDEYHLVNQFFNRCEYAERYRQILYDTLNESVSEKARVLQQELIRFMVEDIKNSQSTYQANREKLIQMANGENWIFQPNRPAENMVDYIQSIQVLTTTTCGAKLKRIARLRK